MKRGDASPPRLLEMQDCSRSPITPYWTPSISDYRVRQTLNQQWRLAICLTSGGVNTMIGAHASPLTCRMIPGNCVGLKRLDSRFGAGMESSSVPIERDSYYVSGLLPACPLGFCAFWSVFRLSCVRSEAVRGSDLTDPAAHRVPEPRGRGEVPLTAARPPRGRLTLPRVTRVAQASGRFGTFRQWPKHVRDPESNSP